MLEQGRVTLADVTPPRANKRRTSLRPIGYQWNNLSAKIREWFAWPTRYFQSETAANGTPNVSFWTAVIPGWPQRALGAMTRARIFFWSWLLLLSFGIIGIGLPGSGTALGLAIGIHVSSILDLFIASVESVARRLLYTGLVSAAILGCVYYPAGLVASYIVTPIQVAVDYGPISAGDVALAFRQTSFAPGDLVVISILRGNNWFAHPELATVLACDRGIVEKAADGPIMVDGQPLQLYSRNQIRSIEGQAFRFEVTKGRTLLLGTDLQFANQMFRSGLYAIRTVDNSDVYGRISFIAGPLSRRSFIAPPGER